MHSTDHTHPLSLLDRGIAAISAHLRTRRQRRQDRAAFHNMASLDDQILHDIGVTRADVQWAAGLPLSQNAAQELRNQALSRRSKS